MSYDIQFEIEEDGKWFVLPQVCQEKLKTEMNAGTEIIEIEVFRDKKSVNFKKMSISMNHQNKNIRCCVKNTSGDFYSWSFKDDNNIWRSYGPKTVVELEQSFDVKDHLHQIEIAGKRYTIHFGRWHQESVDTGYRRKVSRIKSNAIILVEPNVKEEIAEAENGSYPVAKSAASSNLVQKSTMKTIKGRPPVDPEAVPILKNIRAHIYLDPSTNEIYDVLLNQTNLAQNNNKYYIIQLIEADSQKQYWTWTRWGRVGYKGQHNLAACGSDLEEARALFESKFESKTRNNWSARKNFVKYSRKYDMIERDYGAADGDDDANSDNSNDGEVDDAVDAENIGENANNAGKSGSKRKAESGGECITKKAASDTMVASKLDIRIQHLLEMICDVREMEEVVVSMNFDVQKAPLGKLTKAQLKAGYTALKKIADIVSAADSEVRLVSSTRKSAGRMSASSKKSLLEACDEFYTRVPHYFGMRQPPMITTHGEVKTKLELLETLGDIEIAIQSMKKEQSLASPEHPLDKHYRNLNCQLAPVELNSSMFTVINRYLQDTHGPTHNQYKMELVEVFCVDRQSEELNFFIDVGNNALLWHGSRLTNYYGILNQGLRIAPPEAPVTGYMFGKGVYFADCASKSANYCQTSALRNVGFLLLCKVALGKQRELTAADYKADSLPSGYNSVKGLGKFIPDSSSFSTLSDGTVIPAGRLVPNSDPNSARFALLYNEYVVYDIRQVEMKYICKVKFNYSV